MGWMLKEISEMERNYQGGENDVKYLIAMHVIYIVLIAAIYIFLSLTPSIYLCIFFYPSVWIISYILSILDKIKEKKKKKHDIEISYSKLLSKNVDKLIDDIYNKLLVACKSK